MKYFFALASLLFVLGHATPPALAADVALFGVTFIDTSTEGAVNGIRDDEIARIEAFDQQLQEAFLERGHNLLPLDDVQDVLDQTVNPSHCNGCDIRMGETLAADYVVTAEIQKVSNLILGLHVSVREVATGKYVRAASADIRGNTDRSWERGLSYILRNRIFKEDL